MNNRREFLSATVGTAALVPFLTGFRSSPAVPFQHGVASRDPYNPALYDPETSAGALAVEFVTPGVTSPALEDPDTAFLAQEALLSTQSHLRYVDLHHRGYVLLDVNAQRMQAEWYFTPSVTRQTSREIFDCALRTESGANQLEPVEQPSLPKPDVPLPAP